MELIIQTLFDTEWGAIIAGALLFTFFLYEIFTNKPKT